MARNTSVSDNDFYPEFCYMASRHDEIFDKFRVHPVYCRIIPGRLDPYHVKLGLEFLKIIFSNPDLLKIAGGKWSELFKIDSVGSPEIVTYKVDDKTFSCSQLTLRYIKVVSDIVYLFDTNKIKSISEIGIGFGGQCHVSMNLLPISEYNLIDLPEVLALVERCLNKVELLSEKGGG